MIKLSCTPANNQQLTPDQQQALAATRQQIARAGTVTSEQAMRGAMRLAEVIQAMNFVGA